jgi:hypothetical protein
LGLVEVGAVDVGKVEFGAVEEVEICSDDEILA